MTDYTNSGQLISKKELLAKYGISYGALYRWKRKRLIPEEWFIKKTTGTGQETFFPAAAVCERIELILSQKEDILLDELANKLHHEDERNAGLLLITEYGDKRFRLREIKGVHIECPNGKCVDITKQITELVAKYESEQA